MRRDENVSRRDVPVHELLGLQVGQGCGQLIRKQNEGREFESRPVVLQVGAEFAVSGPLHDDPDGVGQGLGANSQKLYDVLVVELLHDS